MNKDNAKIIKAIIFSALAAVLSYGINFFLTRYVTAHIGIEAYGFVSLAKTAVSYADIITIALTSFIVRFITVSYHEKNYKEANAYFSSAIASTCALSVGIFLIAIIVICFLESVLVIPADLISGVKVLFAVVFLNYIVTTITTPFTVSAYIKNRLDAVSIWRIISYILDAVVLLCLFSFFKANVWYVGIGSLAASGMVLLSNVWLNKKLTPELRFNRRQVSLTKTKTLIKHGIWNSFNSLGNTLNSGLDLMISNLMLSGIQTGQIAVAKTVQTIFTTIRTVVFQPFQPILLKTYASGDVKAYVKKTQEVMKVGGLVSGLAFAGFFSLGPLYMRLWLPEQDAGVLYWLTIVTICLEMIGGVISPIHYVNTVTIKNKLPCWITIASGILNVFSMYLLLTHTSIGVYAVAGTTTVIMLMIFLLFNPIYSAYCLKVSPWEFYKIIFPHLFAVGVMTGALWLIGKWFAPTSWITLILTAIPMVLVGTCIYGSIMLNRDEKRKIWHMLIDKFRIKQ